MTATYVPDSELSTSNRKLYSSLTETCKRQPNRTTLCLIHSANTAKQYDVSIAFFNELCTC